MPFFVLLSVAWQLSHFELLCQMFLLSENLAPALVEQLQHNYQKLLHYVLRLK